MIGLSIGTGVLSLIVALTFAYSLTKPIRLATAIAEQLEATAHSMSSTAEHTNQQTAIVAGNAQRAVTNMNALSGATEDLVGSAQDIFALVRNSAELINQAVESARKTDKTARRKSAISSN